MRTSSSFAQRAAPAKNQAGRVVLGQPSDVAARKRLTHAQVARLARTSRTRITAILNSNTKDVSTDLLLRVLYALGYTAKITFQKAA
jgi:hypothetical protein